MGRRVGQLAGILGFGLALWRLGRILQTGPQYPEWRLILAASALLGGLAWWLLDQVVRRPVSKVVILSTGAMLLAARISAASTLIAGFIPTTETLDVAGSQLDLAFRIIRSGVPPVVPHPGLLSILAVVMWLVGILFAWGRTRGPVSAMFLPSVVIYLQFAVFDRKGAGVGWLTASAAMLGLSVLAMALDHRGGTGRARDDAGRPVPSQATGLAMGVVVGLVAVSLTTANAASGLVSEYGNKPWLSGNSSGLGPGSGAVRFDSLVDLKQKVIDRSNAPLFKATISGDGPPAEEIYWRMESLDSFNGEQWTRSDNTLRGYEPGQGLGDESDVYQGTSYDFLQLVQIEFLSSFVAPTAGVPIALQTPPENVLNPRLPNEFDALTDSAILVPSGLSRRDTYQVRSVMADRDADLGALATGPDGQLTPMFQSAFDGGVFPHAASEVDTEAVEPGDLSRFVDLPNDTPPELLQIALEHTKGATTDFEKAWMLQAWFSDSGDFTYSTDVDTGHSALILADWLSDDPSTLNNRTGYCEQFAAAMAVLARTLDVPSRVVWGFTPGEVESQADGTELITVRDTNAHAWVEVWLEPYGWVQFDPTPRGEFLPPSITAGFDPTQFVPEDTATDTTLPQPVRDPNDLTQRDFGALFQQEQPATSVLPWLIIVAVVVLSFAAVPTAKAWRRRRRLKAIRQGDITAAWDEIVDRLLDLGETLPESQTPIELARARGSELVPLASTYSADIYGGHRGNATESDLATAESWIESSYDRPARARAAFSLRSLIRRLSA